jgi:hypothetical protein
MIIYEVNLVVKRKIADDYAAWLKGHIREMLQLPGFESAEWLSDEDFHEEEGADPRWTVHYRLRSHDDFIRYAETDAERMRGEAIERFGRDFEATRRILRVEDAFERVPKRET